MQEIVHSTSPARGFFMAKKINLKNYKAALVVITEKAADQTGLNHDVIHKLMSDPTMYAIIAGGLSAGLREAASYYIKRQAEKGKLKI